MHYLRLEEANKIALRRWKTRYPKTPILKVPRTTINGATHHDCIGTYRKNWVTCSCWMCGNRRRYNKGKDKLTRQERAELLE